MLLNCIVCQVNHFVKKVEVVELFRSSPDVPFLIPVGPEEPVDTGDQHIASEIEFSFIIQHWIFNVFLYNMCFLLSVVMVLITDNILNFLYWVGYFDAPASVWVFPRLYYPDVRLLFSEIFVVLSNKLQKVRILKATDMKCLRNDFVQWNGILLAIMLQVKIHKLLIPNLPFILQMTVHYKLTRLIHRYLQLAFNFVWAHQSLPRVLVVAKHHSFAFALIVGMLLTDFMLKKLDVMFVSVKRRLFLSYCLHPPLSPYKISLV